MTYKSTDKHLLSFIIPAYLGGDFALYRIMSGKYNVKPSAIKILLFMYVRYTLLDGKKSISYPDLIDKGISEWFYLQSIKQLRSAGLVVHVGARKGYIITDKGIECIGDYYKAMSIFIDELEEKFNIKTISDNIVSESSGFYSS